MRDLRARPVREVAEYTPGDVGPDVECFEQPPQEWLIRTTYFPPARPDRAAYPVTPTDPKFRGEHHQLAVEYRTRHYGHFPGFGRAGMNPQPPKAYTRNIKWFGLPITIHRKIAPALYCVEREIKAACSDHPYKARAIGGIRYKNTYHSGEITNHAYGIAIDIDPSINSCCGCVPPWNSNPLCHKKVSSVYERMAMPECWVHAFTKYGFYWLGYDPMQDTMHFEFLGDPEKIVVRK